MILMPQAFLPSWFEMLEVGLSYQLLRSISLTFMGFLQGSEPRTESKSPALPVDGHYLAFFWLAHRSLTFWRGSEVSQDYLSTCPTFVLCLARLQT